MATRQGSQEEVVKEVVTWAGEPAAAIQRPRYPELLACRAEVVRDRDK